MRRFAAVAVIAVVSTLALSACSLPAGIDGNLVNNWSAAPAPTAIVPIAGDCYNDDGSNMLDNPPVTCTSSHALDVAYVGTFTGADAARVTPPATGSPQQRAAYAKCQAPTATFLGADWHSGLLQLTVTLPDEEGWTGGARWFRCDVSVLDYPDGDTTSYSITLKGSLKTNTAASLQCVVWKDHKTYITDIAKSTCSKPFNVSTPASSPRRTPHTRRRTRSGPRSRRTAARVWWRISSASPVTRTRASTSAGSTCRSTRTAGTVATARSAASRRPKRLPANSRRALRESVPRNRRARAGLVVAISAALALAGCSLPTGVDGNLVNDWASDGHPVATGARGRRLLLTRSCRPGRQSSLPAPSRTASR